MQFVDYMSIKPFFKIWGVHGWTESHKVHSRRVVLIYIPPAPYVSACLITPLSALILKEKTTNLKDKNISCLNAHVFTSRLKFFMLISSLLNYFL